MRIVNSGARTRTFDAAWESLDAVCWFGDFPEVVG